MLKLSEKALDDLEVLYPGIKEQIMRFETAVFPRCVHSGSANTADVQIGLIGRTISISAATTKFKLIPFPPRRSNITAIQAKNTSIPDVSCKREGTGTRSAHLGCAAWVIFYYASQGNADPFRRCFPLSCRLFAL